MKTFLKEHLSGYLQKWEVYAAVAGVILSISVVPFFNLAERLQKTTELNAKLNDQLQVLQNEAASQTTHIQAMKTHGQKLATRLDSLYFHEVHAYEKWEIKDWLEIDLYLQKAGHGFCLEETGMDLKKPDDYEILIGEFSDYDQAKSFSQSQNTEDDFTYIVQGDETLFFVCANYKEHAVYYENLNIVSELWASMKWRETFVLKFLREDECYVFLKYKPRVVSVSHSVIPGR